MYRVRPRIDRPAGRAAAPQNASWRVVGADGDGDGAAAAAAAMAMSAEPTKRYIAIDALRGGGLSSRRL